MKIIIYDKSLNIFYSVFLNNIINTSSTKNPNYKLL